LRYVRAGLFIALGTAIADGIDGLLSTIVARPRPQSPLIHVYMPEPFHSFPSGHTEHDIVYYGFLLYLSMTDTVRQWRYRWVLLPFQVFAVVAIIAIGYSRIWEGSHWLTDVVGGYLSGAILLYLLIMLYRWAGVWWERRQARKRREQVGVTQQVRTT
jgi:undecaprenyl-diphosphatase